MVYLRVILTICATLVLHHCVVPPTPKENCGNGILEGKEQCDDGNTLTEACPYGIEYLYGGLASIPKVGGSITVRATGDYPNDLLYHDSALYWSSAYPASSGGGSIKRVLLPSHNVQFMLDAFQPNDLAVDDTYLYYVGYGSPGFGRIDLSTLAHDEFASYGSHHSGVAVDDNNLFLGHNQYQCSFGTYCAYDPIITVHAKDNSTTPAPFFALDPAPKAYVALRIHGDYLYARINNLDTDTVGISRIHLATGEAQWLFDATDTFWGFYVDDRAIFYTVGTDSTLYKFDLETMALPVAMATAASMRPTADDCYVYYATDRYLKRRVR